MSENCEKLWPRPKPANKSSAEDRYEISPALLLQVVIWSVRYSSTPRLTSHDT